jgi:mono/diheme cytochrome c family protein
MKKLVVRVALGLVALVALAVAGLVVKFFVLSPAIRPPPDLKAKATPEVVAHGKYLVEHVTGCTGCHSPVDDTKPGDFPVEGKRGAGRDFGPMGKAPFRLRAHNLTPDAETGIGTWTDGEVVRALREGVGKDGHTLFPQMPWQTYAKALSDDDALAIVAYLRTLPAVKNDPGKTEVKFPVSMFIRGLPKPLASSPPAPPLPTDRLARGRWLLDVCSCRDCHDSVTPRMEKVPGKGLAGGMSFPIPKGVVYAANITSDKATGIGSYSDEDLRRILDEGKNKAGRSLYVMPWSFYSGLTKEDKEALIAALREVPPVANTVAASAID